MRQIWESNNMGFTPKSVFKINQLKSCLFKYKSVICFVPLKSSCCLQLYIKLRTLSTVTQSMSPVNHIQHLHFKHVFPAVNFCLQPYYPPVIISGLCLIAA